VFEIGSTLREARVRRKLTLQQAEDDTKIRVKYIQAMENEDFDVMPSPAYVKGFVRTYATYLGLDADMLLEEYRSRFEPSEEHDAFGGSSALRPRHHKRRNTLAFVALVCVLALGLLWILGKYGGDTDEPSPEPSPSMSHSASPTPSRSPKATPTPTAAKVVLVVKADLGATYLEVRRTANDGAVLFDGTLEQGQRRSFENRGTIFVRIDKPQLVLVAVGDGELRRPEETVATDYLVTRKGVTPR
jgi:cytoskeleton protein RodZ